MPSTFPAGFVPDGFEPDDPPQAEPEQAPPQGSAAGRFASNLGAMLNPVTMAQGAYQAVRHPGDTYNALVDASAEQFGKAGDAFSQGRYSEAIGHGAAGIIPAIGPAAANVGEQIGEGDIAGGLGATTGLLAPMGIARGAQAARVPIGQATSATGRAISAAGKSPLARRVAGPVALGAAVQGNIPTAIFAAAIPKAAEVLGVSAQRLGEAIAGINPVTAAEVAAFRLKLASPALAKNPMARAAILTAINKRGGSVPAGMQQAAPVVSVNPAEAFAAKYGLPSDAEVSATVLARNARGGR